MLAKKIFAVVVAVGGAHNHMDVLAAWHASRMNVSRTDGLLMIELYENHRTVDSIVEDRIIGHTADPGKVSLIQMLIDLSHSYTCMAIVHVTHEEAN